MLHGDVITKKNCWYFSLLYLSRITYIFVDLVNLIYINFFHQKLRQQNYYNRDRNTAT